MPGALCTWNLFNKDFDPNTPDVVLDTQVSFAINCFRFCFSEKQVLTPICRPTNSQSCLMCVACHPEKPAIVAAGSFNGEVYVWNTAAEEQVGCVLRHIWHMVHRHIVRISSCPNFVADSQLIACTKIDDYFHREPISKVTWVYNMRTQRYEVCSISGDGNVLFWSLESKLSYPTQG